MRAGDLIVQVDGNDLSADRQPVDELLRLAREWDPDEVVTLVAIRDGAEQSFRVQPEEAELPMVFGMGDMEGRWEELGPRLDGLAPRIRSSLDGARWNLEGWGATSGLTLAPLNPDLGRYFGTEEGVLVTEVASDTDLELRAGDVILSVGARSVKNPAAVRRILRSYAPDEMIELEIRRDGTNQTVTGTRR